MDLNLDWMTLDDFQKHLNGEDEILSGPPLSPSKFLLSRQDLDKLHFEKCVIYYDYCYYYYFLYYVKFMFCFVSLTLFIKT